MLEIFKQLLRSSESLKQWFERQRTRACVPHIPCTSVLKFALPTVGENTGYGLLHIQESKVHATFLSLSYACYAHYINGNTIEKNDISSNFQFVAWAMPAKIRKVV